MIVLRHRRRRGYCIDEVTLLEVILPFISRLQHCPGRPVVRPQAARYLQNLAGAVSMAASILYIKKLVLAVHS